MKSIRLAFALSLLMGGAASAAPSFNYQYDVQGDQAAAPIQAFDDGAQLYVQLRDPAAPPVPMGATGPLQYRIKGYYMVLPLVSSVTLHMGQYQSRVVSTGYANGLSQVVSVTGAVDALAPVARPAEAPAVLASLSAQTSLRANSASADEVRGEIVVGGREGLVSSGATRQPPSWGARTVSFADAALASTYKSFASKPVVIGAGGTVAGARAAVAARQACQSAGATCEVDYKAGFTGVLTIEMKEMH